MKFGWKCRKFGKSSSWSPEMGPSESDVSSENIGDYILVKKNYFPEKTTTILSKLTNAQYSLINNIEGFLCTNNKRQTIHRLQYLKQLTTVKNCVLDYLLNYFAFVFKKKSFLYMGQT